MPEYDIEMVSWSYVAAILERFPASSFCQSLKRQLDERGRLTKKQLDYVLGRENPKGGKTFEAKCLKMNPQFQEQFLDPDLADAGDDETAEADFQQEHLGHWSTNEHGQQELDFNALINEEPEHHSMRQVGTRTYRSISQRSNMQELHRHIERDRMQGMGDRIEQIDFAEIENRIVAQSISRIEQSVRDLNDYIRVNNYANNVNNMEVRSKVEHIKETMEEINYDKILIYNTHTNCYELINRMQDVTTTV